MKAITVADVLRLFEENGIYEESFLSEEEEQKVVAYISYNSQDMKPDTLFICKGKAFKKEYLEDALNKGSIAYIAEDVILEEKPYILVNDVRKAMVLVSTAFHDDVWNKQLKMVGVTGTKGKTTTTFYTKSILDCYTESQGKGKNGMLTGEYVFDGKVQEEAGLTTPEVFDLHRHLARCCENGCEYLVMETSSQALKYGRTDGLKYTAGAFLNIGDDHISEIEHPDLDDYLNSKLRIFQQCEIAAINRDQDEEIFQRAYAEGKKYCKDVITYGLSEDAEVRGYDIEATLETLKFTVNCRGEVFEVEANIGGYYNVMNILTAIAMTSAMGVPVEAIKEGVFKAKARGRLEVFDLPNKKDVKVIVDYAHNEMSYNALFESINKICPGRKKIFIFGLTGDRAFGRRRMGGEVADREADRVVLTQVTPGSEDPYKICEEIRSYISPEKDVKILVNRKEAIRYALDTVEDGWLVVFIGFSSCYSQKLDGKWVRETKSDIDAVKDYIEEHK